MDNRYLTLKGRNKDTWYIQVRVPKHLQKIAKKTFIKQSTKTSDIKVARKLRDEIVGQLKSLDERNAQFSLIQVETIMERIINNLSVLSNLSSKESKQKK